MSKNSSCGDERVSRRLAREAMNLFSRLPAITAASRKQGQKLLQQVGGLSIVEWRTLWDLTEAGPLTVRQLSEIQRTDHSLLSRALPDMKRKGYVDMRRDEADGRQTIVALTDQGRSAFERAAPLMKKRREALRATFTPEEIATIVGYLDRLEVFLHRPFSDFMDDHDS